MKNPRGLVAGLRAAVSARGGHSVQVVAAVLLSLSLLTCANGGSLTSEAKHKVIVRGSDAVGLIAPPGGKLIGDYGSFSVYEIDQNDTGLAKAKGIEPADDFNFVMLNAGPIDTSSSAAQAKRLATAEFSGKRLHLVQFAGPVQAAWYAALTNSGVQIVAFIPENAYLVYGDAKSIANVQGQSLAKSFLQWDASYVAEYKIDPLAKTTDAKGLSRKIGTDLFTVQLVADPAANPGTLALIEQLKLKPVKQQISVLGYVNVIVSLDPATLDTLASQPDVVSIQPFFEPTKKCERQDQIVAGNLTGNIPSGPGYLAWLATKGFTQTQFNNSAFVVDLTDSGIDNGTLTPNHPGLFTAGDISLASRVVYSRLEGTANPGSSLQGCDGHGTINAHIIGGFDAAANGFPHTDSTGFHYGLGLCPFVRMGASVIFDPDSYTFPNFTKLQSDAYHDGARISNNSWGGGSAGAYDATSQQYDALVRDAQPAGSSYPTAGNQEMVIIFANGNDGPDSGSVRHAATAKNVLAVGAAESVQAMGGADGCLLSDSDADSANDLAWFSSHGPCRDGRHKPEITAPGTHVSGGVAQASNPGPTGTAIPCFDASGVCGGLLGNMFFPVGQQLYTTCSGTSQATPAAAGAAALLRQYFINNYTNPPTPAMTKAYLANSARYMTGAYANDTLWSDTQGMGEVNIGTAFDDSIRVLRDQDPADLFTASGQTRVFVGRIGNTNRPFRVTVAWTDAPGSTTGSAYNNDLDLTVTVGGKTYLGNVFAGQYSVTGGTADAKNNMESVFLPAGVSGEFLITVTAMNINSDGVPNNGIPLDQDFALVAYNASPAPPVINSIQPTNTMILVGQAASFSVVASGPPPLAYQWLRNGTNIAGATASIFTIASATTNDTASYAASVSNSGGSVSSSNVSLTVIVPLPLPFSLNNSNLTWLTDSNTPWFGESAITHDNVAAGRTYFIQDGGQTSLRTAVMGPGTLTFWWKVSSQTNADKLRFLIGSNLVASVSGEVNWQLQTIYLGAGPQDLLWQYAKDGTGKSGSDAGFVDQVTFSAGATAPFITVPPVSQTSVQGKPITFAVGAGGTPVLAYQWMFEGSPLAGATGSSVTVLNPGSDQAGAYSVTVNNGYGSPAVAGAMLSVIPLATIGDNFFDQLDISATATNAFAIAAGAWHNLVVRPDGSVAAWGYDGDGQCDVPVTATQVVAVAAGGYHSLALLANGTVLGWGADYNGQATPPAGLSNVVALSAGAWHSLALRADGTMAAWGDNSWGQGEVPAGLTNVVAIAAGGNHNLALLGDGRVIAWGDNADANGLYVGESYVPIGLANVAAIAAGDYHSLAVKEDGTVVAWGDSSEGQLNVPPTLRGVVAVAAGASHSLALTSSGKAIGWGANWNGQSAIPLGLDRIKGIAAGNSHSLFLVGTPSLKMLFPQRHGNEFRFSFMSQSGRAYRLEYKASLSDPVWTPLSPVAGNGGLRTVAYPTTSSAQRFYRLRQVAD